MASAQAFVVMICSVNLLHSLTRSATLLTLLRVKLAVGNLHVVMGPVDLNGPGRSYARLFWTGFGLPANIDEEYVFGGDLQPLEILSRNLSRTWD